MQIFPSGATRDSSDDKLNYVGFLSPTVLRRYAEYIQSHRIQTDGTLRAADNWKKGIPLQRYMESLMRHIMDVWLIHDGVECADIRDGHVVTIEEALCAVIFNASGYLHELLKHPLYLQPAQAACDDGELSGLEPPQGSCNTAYGRDIYGAPGGKPIPTAETYYT